MTTHNQIPDEIFAQALARLQNGESIDAIAKNYEGYQQELTNLLFVAQMGMGIPKITPPTPYKAYRFTDTVAATKGFTEWLAYFRVAIIPIVLVIVLVGGNKFANGVEGSLPGQKLYTLKRATEQARLSLTRDQNKVAGLHVEFMQNRIDEVKKAADEGDENSEKLAIAELKSQTEKTFAEAGPVATANAISKQDSTLLENLVAINKQQKDVLAELSTSSESDSAKIVAVTALEENKKNDVTLAKIIATVNDQTMADLPNKVSVTGNITFYNGVAITVEKNAFTINANTTFTGIDGLDIPTSEIAAKTIYGRVTVIGTRIENGTLVAKQVILVAAETEGSQDGTVKGDSTIKPVVKPIVKPVEPTNTNTTPPVTEPEAPTKATGSYITEPSSQQYAP